MAEVGWDHVAGVRWIVWRESSASEVSGQPEILQYVNVHA